MQNWKERREYEVMGKRKRSPYNLGTFFAAALLHFEVDIIRPDMFDCDDIIAEWSILTHWDILSQDTDFLRYPDLNFSKLFIGFAFQEGHVVFIPQCQVVPSKNKKKSLRSRLSINLLQMLPEFRRIACRNTILSKRNPHLFYTGTTDGHTKKYGNLHQKCQPLRQALYSKQHIDHVREIFPIWKDDKVQWSNEIIYPNTCCQNVLETPVSTLQWIKKQDSGNCIPPYRHFAHVVLSAEFTTSHILMTLYIAAWIDSTYDHTRLFSKNKGICSYPGIWNPPWYWRTHTCKICKEIFWLNDGCIKCIEENEYYSDPKTCKICKSERKSQ